MPEYGAISDQGAPPEHGMSCGSRGATAAADVLLGGAARAGLTPAHSLGLHGGRTLVVEERPTLIDYPRGVGIDDESLRTFQSIGGIDRVLPHTTPNQIMRFVDADRRLLAEIAPTDTSFGWP